MEDITKTGPVGLKGINRNNNNSSLLKGEEFDSFLKSLTLPSSASINVATALATTDDSEFSSGLDLGSSIFDQDIYTIDELNRAGDIRAENQPWYAKIAAGVTKGTILAGTTFADGIAGTIAGLINVATNADEIANSENPIATAGEKFIFNPISSTLAEVNEKSEKWLPNYYTKAEQENPWYENIFTANFIGDKFLKNLGFTIGAAYSGKVTAGVASKAMGLKGVRDAFKGAVTTASGKVLNTADEIAKAYKTGDAFMDGVKLTEDLGKAAKRLKNAEWKLKTIGAVSGAMGEGRIEAINNADQWAEAKRLELEDKKEQQIQNIERDLFNEHPEWFSLVDVGDGRHINIITNQEGQLEWEKRKANIENAHSAALEEMAINKARMANVVFAANTLFLTGSNMLQYGRFLSGGYTSGRQYKNLITGSIKDGFKGNKDIARNTHLIALSNPLVEMNEEMTQAFISETSGLKYGVDVDNFFSSKINPKAEEETSGWLNAVVQGVDNTYGNIDRWEEGFLGFLTGALGIPKVGIVTNEQGKKRLKISLDGELWEGLREARNISKETASLVDALNKRVQDPDFINYYQGSIRHAKYQNDMEAALAEGKNFDYKNAEHSQLVSDAIMFDKAGRIQDLYDIVEEARNISIEDINDIRAMSIDKATGKSIFEGKTDEEVIKHIKKQAEDTKKKIDSYISISNDLKSLYGDNISSDHLEELTWMMTQVDDWENRTKSIIKGIREVIGEKAAVIHDRFGIDINTTLGNLEWMMNHFKEDDNIINKINEIIYNKNITAEEGKARIEALIKEKEQLRNRSGLKLGNEIKHIRKKARLRREALQKQYNRLSKRLDILTQEDIANKDKAKEAYKAELERLTKEIQDFYSDNSHDDSKIEDLRIQAMDAFERFTEQSGSMNASLQAVEDYLYKQVLQPLITLEGERSRSTWEKNREDMARRRQQELSESLFSQIVALKDLLNDEKYQLVDPLNASKLSDDLMDLVKLYTARSKFISKYTELSENPELFTQEAQEKINKILADIQDKKVQKAVSSIKDIKDVQDFKNKIKDVEAGIKDRVLEELEKEEFLKDIITAYRDLEESKKIIDDIIKGEQVTPELISAANVINDAFNNSPSLENAKTIIADSLDILPKPVADTILSIMDKYTDNIESAHSSKKDKKKSKKKLKNKEDKKEDSDKSKVRSLLDSLSDSDDTPDAMQLEESPKKKTIEEKIEGADTEELQQLAEGKANLTDTNDTEKSKKAITEIAKKELEKRENPLVHSEEEDGDSIEGNSESNNPLKDALESSLRSWAVTQYTFNELKDRDIRRAVPYTDERVPELIKLGAFEFVDSGRLGDLFNKNENIPIHYISTKGTKLDGTILLAIEVTEDVDSINPIIAQDGKKYQIVGTLGYNANNKEAYEGYKAIVDYMSDERGEDSSEYFVSELTNKINHIYSGRMVKSTQLDPTVRQRSLKVILKGEKPYFGVYYSDVDFRTTLPEDAIRVELNENNGNPRKGSLWLMVKEADGRYYAKAIKIKRFNAAYDIKANRNTPIVERIIENLKTLVDPNKSNEERALAKFDLQEVLYFPKGTTILFNKNEDSNEVAISITGFEDNIGEGLEMDEKVELLLSTLQSDELNLKFQVSPNKLSDSKYVQDLLDSNILTTDLAQLHNINASFDLYLPNIKTKGIKETKKPSVGHTGRLGKNRQITSDTIIHNGEEYRIIEGNIVHNEEIITDQSIIDEVMFISQIKAGTIQPIEGSDNLYVGHYSNGVKFGVVNYTIKKGKELEDLIEKSKKAKKSSEEEMFTNYFVDASEDETTQEEIANEEIDIDNIEDAFVISEDEDIQSNEEEATNENFELTDFSDSKDFSLNDLFVMAETEGTKDTYSSPLGPSIREEFNEDTVSSHSEVNKTHNNFDSIVRSNPLVVAKLGFSNINEFKKFIEDNNLADLNTITTQEAFDALIEDIQCHL